MTARRDRADTPVGIGVDAPATPSEVSDLDALSAHVGHDDSQDGTGDSGLAGEDDAKLDLGAIAHSSMPRAPRSFAATDDSPAAANPGAANSAQADSATRPVDVSRGEPTFAVSIRLLQGILLGFCGGLLAGWVLFAGGPPSAPTVAPAVKSPTSVEADQGRDTQSGSTLSEGAGAAPANPAAINPSAAAEPPVDARPAQLAAAQPPPAAIPGRLDTASQPPRRPLPRVPPPAEPAGAQIPQPAPPQAPAPGPRAMDTLLDDALGRRPGPAPDAPAPPGVPEAPSQADVGDAIRVLIPAISGCAAGHRGVAVVSLVVRNTGRVASARVTGAPFEGTPAGGCMEGVVRKARFPRFTRPTFRVQLPLKIE